MRLLTVDLLFVSIKKYYVKIVFLHFLVFDSIRGKKVNEKQSLNKLSLVSLTWDRVVFHFYYKTILSHSKLNKEINSVSCKNK